jgi:hypothetical protein
MATTIITPRRRGNPLTKGSKLFTKKLGDDALVNMENGKAVGDFNGEELPATVQGRRIRYSLGKSKYVMLDENGRELGDADVQDFVKRAYLTYEEGPNKGTLITSADPYNRKDPFFNHKELAVFLKEGNGKLEADKNTKDRLLLAGLRGSSEFASSKDNSRSAAVRYVISDKDQEAALLSQDRNRKIECIRRFVALTDAKKLIIGKIMGLGVNESNDRDTVDNAIYNAITSTRVNITDMDSEELNLRFLIASAKGNSVIKPSKSGWTFRGNRIASTDGGLYDYFKKYENHETLLLLEEAMGRVYSVPKDQKPVEPKEDGQINLTTE